MTRVLVLGSFDLTHTGHVRFLKQAKMLSAMSMSAGGCVLGELWVALNSDDFIRRYKRPPILTYAERSEMLKALRVVDHVFPNFGAEDSKPAIIHARKGVLDPMIIAHGDDWTGESYMEQLQVTPEWLQARDIRIEYVPYSAGISTTEILDRIAGQDYTPYCRCGTICIGQASLDEQTEHGIAPRRKCRGL